MGGSRGDGFRGMDMALVGPGDTVSEMDLVGAGRAVSIGMEIDLVGAGGTVSVGMEMDLV